MSLALNTVLTDRLDHVMNNDIDRAEYFLSSAILLFTTFCFVV